MKCSQCLHWHTKHGEAEFGQCNAVPEGSAVADGVSRGFDPYPADGGGDEAEARWELLRRKALQAAMAYLHSARRAELITAPNFFCALFAKHSPQRSR